MRKKIIIGVLAVLVIAVLFLFLLMPKGPDLAKYEFLREPRITTLPDQNMVVVEAQGDPNTVGSRAFGLLFKTYYKIGGGARGPKQPAPRARWAGDMKMKSSWTGYYALPVTNTVAALPAIDAEPGFKVELTKWEYGNVAEILHVGPYAAETPTIEKLHAFIKQKGFEITGYHEEEYLKGPGMFFKGDPAGYYTIIRYRVAKKKTGTSGSLTAPAMP
jgi:hypothetical protein